MANAILAAILSLIIPGIGQIYEGDTKRGLMFLIVAIILYGLNFIIPYIGIIGFIFAIYAAYDAYTKAN